MKKRKYKLTVLATALAFLLFSPTYATLKEGEVFLNKEINGMPVLSSDEQTTEIEWFINAARPFKEMKIKVVSETIATHEYESKVLAKAFSEITGIKVTYDLISGGYAVEKLQTQIQSGQNINDTIVWQDRRTADICDKLRNKK